MTSTNMSLCSDGPVSERIYFFLAGRCDRNQRRIGESEDLPFARGSDRIKRQQSTCQLTAGAMNAGHTETEGNITAGIFDGGAGAVLAGKTPLGRLGRVTDIAPLAVFLASDESALTTGEVIPAAGGLVVAT
jgi:hypothetical protein